jgi:DNA-binding transcriptional LysR family regulator
VTELEERLKTRLLQRTTRKLGLTDEGRTFYEHAARIVAETEDAERAIGRLREAPRGLLRVTAPINASYFGAIVVEYLQRFRDVRVELFCTGRVVDLVEERFDLGIRAGALSDSSLIARSLGTARWFLVASPAYLRRRGRPRTPGDLQSHDAVLFGAGPTGSTFRLEREGKSVHVTMTARLLVTDMDVARDAAIAGLGIALLPAYQCVEELRARTLERVLREWNPPPTPVHVVYPSTRHLSPKVKTFADLMQKRMTPPPWELGPVP